MATLDIGHKQVQEFNIALVELRRNMEQLEASVYYTNEKWRELPELIRGSVDTLVTLHVESTGAAMTTTIRSASDIRRLQRDADDEDAQQ